MMMVLILSLLILAPFNPFSSSIGPTISSSSGNVTPYQNTPLDTSMSLPNTPQVS